MNMELFVRSLVLKDIVQVGNRLHHLRLSQDGLLAIIEAMVAASRECTENDPSGARGWRSWQMGTRRAREVFAGIDGWVKDDTDQIPSIFNGELGIKMVVCNTDDGTCLEGREPQNRSRKGPGTERLVECNQIDMFSGGHIPHPDSKSRGFAAEERLTRQGPITYMLCVFHESDDIRAELSCVVEATGGFFAKFGERIFIIGGETGTPDLHTKKTAGDESEFDIPVLRRK